MYQIETSVLNQAVKRNLDRFPEKFRFQLTEEEMKELESQIAISNQTNENLKSQTITLNQSGYKQGLLRFLIITSLIIVLENERRNYFISAR